MVNAPWLGPLVTIALGACSTDPPPDASHPQRARLTAIRDATLAAGLHNGALMAGIAMSETHLAHCWSEATYACMGPASPDCDGPVIAGSADGPCAAMQGGLGLFQFDAGTWADTLATYGDTILTVDGSTATAVRFVIDKVMAEIDGAGSAAAAIAWLDAVPLDAGDPVMARWAQLMACRYNGCCAATALCQSRADGYRDHAIALYDELGPAFWRAP